MDDTAPQTRGREDTQSFPSTDTHDNRTSSQADSVLLAANTTVNSTNQSNFQLPTKREENARSPPPHEGVAQQQQLNAHQIEDNSQHGSR